MVVWEVMIQTPIAVRTWSPNLEPWKTSQHSRSSVLRSVQKSPVPRIDLYIEDTDMLRQPEAYALAGSY
jgi:hypothetical protein